MKINKLDGLTRLTEVSVYRGRYLYQKLIIASIAPESPFYAVQSLIWHPNPQKNKLRYRVKTKDLGIFPPEKELRNGN